MPFSRPASVLNVMPPADRSQMVARHFAAAGPCMLMSKVAPTAVRGWRLCSDPVFWVKRFSMLSGQGLGPADQLRDFLRDHRLTRAVRVQHVAFAHLLRVLRG